jgi:hypothetical protein
LRAHSVLLALLAACGPTVIWSGRTADRRQRLEVVERGGLDYVAIDGVRRAAYHGIAGWSIQTAGSHLAFAARIGRGWFVIADGKPGPGWDAIGAIVLDDTGNVAYAARRGAQWFVVDRRGTSAPCDAILDHSLQLAGGHVAYVGESAGHVHAVVDGTQGPPFDAIGHLLLASDGTAAYTARRGDDAFVVAKGVISQRWGAVAQLALAHGHVAYAASSGQGWHIVHDDREGPTVDAISQLVLRDDGAAVAWAGKLADVRFVALDETPLTGWPGTAHARFALRPASAGAAPALAYVLPSRTGEQVVLDGHAGPAFDEIRTPVWAATGQLAYAARRGATWFVIADGKEVVQATALGDPVWSATGRLGVVARRGHDTLVIVDGHEHRVDLAFEDSLAFSADGTRWGVIAGNLAREQLFIWIDGRRTIDVPSHELYSAAASQPPDVLRAWVAAELR